MPIEYASPNSWALTQSETLPSVSVVPYGERRTGVSWSLRIRFVGGYYPLSLKVKRELNALSCCAQRFARADKRAKLPRWINQYITETAANLSTDMALTLSKLFMRTISQNAGENLTGVSLWTVEDVEKAQAAQRQTLEEQSAAAAVGPSQQTERRGPVEPMDEDDYYEDVVFSDRMLGEVDLDI
jgi:DNA excision repair protein ERCC-2